MVSAHLDLVNKVVIEHLRLLVSPCGRAEDPLSLAICLSNQFVHNHSKLGAFCAPYCFRGTGLGVGLCRGSQGMVKSWVRTCPLRVWVTPTWWHHQSCMHRIRDHRQRAWSSAHTASSPCHGPDFLLCPEGLHFPSSGQTFREEHN